MGRQTGDYLLGTTFLALAILLVISQEKSESGLRSSEQRGVSDAVPPPNRKVVSDRPQFPSIAAASSHPTRAVLKNLSRGTRVVVGSLDLSGRRHQLLLAVGSSGPIPESSLPFIRCSINEMTRCQDPASLPNPICRHVETRRVLADRPVCSGAANTSFVRVFLTPHFTDTGTVHEPTECCLIGESPRVRVLIDHRLMQSKTAGQITFWSQSLSSAVEIRALPVVERWIGKISDVDHDQKLSLVVTDLDHRSRNATNSSPIHGCIRTADFRCGSDFSGDIVYIDPGVFELPTDELAALLTHEITHAAVCSMQADESPDKTDSAQSGSPRAGLQISPWLSEAVAHFVELQCIDADAGAEAVSENFRRRMDAFLADPAGSPIVAAEDVLSLEERRSGSRAAATLFLARWISSEEELKQFLRSAAAVDRRIEQLAAAPFSEVFRDWTLSLATMNILPSATSTGHQSLRLDRLSAASNHARFAVIGTAFRCFECCDNIESLVIESDGAAQLQISIIESEAHIRSVKMD